MLVWMKEVFMSSKRSQAGCTAGTPHDSKQADPDSPDGCEAPPAESGSEGIRGASPSNTAPHNSNLLEKRKEEREKENGFRLFRVAVDSLYLSFPGEISPAIQATLIQLKAYAQSLDIEEQCKAQYPLGGHIFEVKDKGARMFPYVLEDNAYRIQLARAGKKSLPMAYVKVSAEYLAHKGPLAVQEELHELLQEFGNLTGSNVVSRVDLAVDFCFPVLMDSWHRSAWVTRATEIHSYSKDQVFTGWSIGMGGIIGGRLYNKIQEIVHSGKTWAMNLWLPMGWKPGEDVWRLEFEFKREFLKDRGLTSLDDVLDNLNGLWSYATTEWLRLTVPNETDSTRARWPTHELWSTLASVDWNSEQGVLLDKCTTARNPTELRLIAVVLGAMTSYMAMHGIDDRNVAINQLATKLYEHYSQIAAKKDLSFDEYLAFRIAVKAREFNTAINAPGLTDNLKQDFLDEGEEAYRRASRGW